MNSGMGPGLRPGPRPLRCAPGPGRFAAAGYGEWGRGWWSWVRVLSLHQKMRHVRLADPGHTPRRGAVRRSDSRSPQDGHRDPLRGSGDADAGSGSLLGLHQSCILAGLCKVWDSGAPPLRVRPRPGANTPNRRPPRPARRPPARGATTRPTPRRTGTPHPNTPLTSTDTHRSHPLAPGPTPPQHPRTPRLDPPEHHPGGTPAAPSGTPQNS